ncbi:MAG: hypothetical protein WD066_04090, partial [Planctomycetaceae bacterium]
RKTHKIKLEGVVGRNFIPSCPPASEFAVEFSVGGRRAWDGLETPPTLAEFHRRCLRTRDRSSRLAGTTN